jgi:hypothetical protein
LPFFVNPGFHNTIECLAVCCSAERCEGSLAWRAGETLAACTRAAWVAVTDWPAGGWAPVAAANGCVVPGGEGSPACDHPGPPEKGRARHTSENRL